MKRDFFVCLENASDVCSYLILDSYYERIDKISPEDNLFFKFDLIT